MNCTRRDVSVLLLCGAVTACSSPEAATSTTTVYLVRHAEKAAGDDPGLTEAGRARAEALAECLSGAGLTHIHSSDYARTRQTASVVADRAGLPVTLYDPRDLPGMAAVLRLTPGVHLVVGHSNTTPELARLLGADAEPMSEAEYDRLIRIELAQVGDRQDVRRDVERYGAPSEGLSE